MGRIICPICGRMYGKTTEEGPVYETCKRCSTTKDSSQSAEERFTEVNQAVKENLEKKRKKGNV